MVTGRWGVSSAVRSVVVRSSTLKGANMLKWFLSLFQSTPRTKLVYYKSEPVQRTVVSDTYWNYRWSQ